MISSSFISTAWTVFLLSSMVSAFTAPNSLYSSKSQRNCLQAQPQKSTYTLEVSYEGRTCTTSIQKGESILSALERSGTADRLSMPAMPSDCRRGNCLTCVGRHAEHSDHSNLVRGEDGLTPYMSREARKRGYILTCSSYVTGEGVKLQIGKNQDAWDELYRGRLEEEPTKEAGRAAMAKVIRLNAESHLDKWAKETEETLRKTESN